MHTIREQYNLLATGGPESDFNAMIDWLEYWGMKPCKSEYFGEEVNAILVKNWVSFRESLTNTPKRYEREYLEQCALDACEADDVYDLQDTLGETSDEQLMVIGRLFYADSAEREPKSNEPVTSIDITWQIGDVQEVRPDLTDEQASEVLQYADRCHDANEGISWDVLRIHAEHLFPEPEQEADGDIE